MDPTEAKQYGIQPEHLIGYRDEYEWIQSHWTSYGVCPTVDALQSKYPEFPHSPDQHDVRFPATEIRRQAAARKLSRATMAAGDLLSRGKIEEAYEQIVDLRLETVSSRPVSALIDPAFMDDYHDTAEVRVPMPWNTLQGVTNGQGPGELWYFAARQGKGKSSFLINMACESARKGNRVLFYSLEMTKRQVQVKTHTILGRMLGQEVNHTEMLHRRFDSGKYKSLLQEIERRIPGRVDIHTPDMGMVTPSVIAARAGEYDQVFVDYIGLVKADDGTPAIKDYRVIAEISNELKQIALSKKTRVVAAAQINREGVSANMRPPRLHTLAQSDHLGNDGDVVLTMKEYGRGASVVSVEKNRHGASGNLFWTSFDANAGNYEEITRDRAEQILADSQED
jgi:replicative DNA helicase